MEDKGEELEFLAVLKIEHLKNLEFRDRLRASINERKEQEERKRMAEPPLPLAESQPEPVKKLRRMNAQEFEA